jgi:hypothetical protein
MRFTVDTSDMRNLDIQMSRIGRSFDRGALMQTGRRAFNPMVVATRQEAPIGRIKRSATGRTKADQRTDGTHDRGGATRRDIRFRVVNGQGEEVVRFLVGVDGRLGHVGWRTHLITRKNVHRLTPDDFLARAYGRTIDVSLNRLGTEAQWTIERVLRRK